MDCAHVKIGGANVIICGSRRRVKPCHTCREIAAFQCDWKLGGGKTCDAWICDAHAQEVGPDKHLCPEHQAAYHEWKARRAAREMEKT